MIAIVGLAAMLAEGGGDLRHDFVACLKSAASQAQTQKVGIDGFVAFARTNCANTEGPFRDQLVTTDVQHGMSRKESASDAASQVEDYYSEWLDNYKAIAPPPLAKAPVPAEVTQAAQPKP